MTPYTKNPHNDQEINIFDLANNKTFPLYKPSDINYSSRDETFFLSDLNNFNFDPPSFNFHDK